MKSTSTLHEIPSSNYWQSHHPFRRMYRNLIITVVFPITIISIVSITVVVLWSRQVLWQDQKELTSRHCPVWVCEYYPVILGPFSKHFLFSDKPMPPIWSMFMKKIFITLISSLFIVMIRDFSISFCPKKRKKEKERRIEMKNEAFTCKNPLCAQ